MSRFFAALLALGVALVPNASRGDTAHSRAADRAELETSSAPRTSSVSRDWMLFSQSGGAMTSTAGSAIGTLFLIGPPTQYVHRSLLFVADAPGAPDTDSTGPLLPRLQDASLLSWTRQSDKQAAFTLEMVSLSLSPGAPCTAACLKLAGTF